MSKVQIPEDGSSAVMLTDRHGAVRYFNEFGQLHREGDKPALIDRMGDVSYYHNGLLHRDGDKPALINSSQEVFYKNGSLHRENGPAVIHFITEGGSKQVLSQSYYQNGVMYREHGPALLWDSGSYQYYKNGQLHNENGPACHWVENGKTRDEYYLNGEYVSKLSHKISTMRNSSSSSQRKMSM